jgi:hypothetical protein
MLLAVRLTPVTSADVFGVVVVPATVAMPLRENLAIPATFRAAPVVLTADTPVSVTEIPFTPVAPPELTSLP